MRTITMTQLNQQVSAVTREVVESGEPVEVTNRWRVVLPHRSRSPRPACSTWR